MSVVVLLFSHTRTYTRRLRVANNNNNNNTVKISPSSPRTTDAAENIRHGNISSVGSTTRALVALLFSASFIARDVHILRDLYTYYTYIYIIIIISQGCKII